MIILQSEGLSNDVGGEGCHDLTGVWLDDSTEERNRSGDSLFRKECENSQLSKTSVVQFSFEALLLSFGAHVLAELKRVVEVEWDRVGDSVGSSGEVFNQRST